MKTQKIFIMIIYTNPMIAPYRPASDMDFGTEIKAIPTYIFIKFAAVKYHGDPLLFLVYLSRCFSENNESVYFGQLLLGFPLLTLVLIEGAGSLSAPPSINA